MVTILGRPERGAAQVEKSPRLNRAIQFLTVAYDGACFPNVSLKMAPSAPCFAGIKIDVSSRLHVVEIARVA